MMAVCPVCGKNTAIHWPENWVYRRGEKYLCSENCMIVFDTREFKERTGWIDDYYRRKKEMRKKISLEQKKKAVEIALGGGNPLKYLEDCGSANPSAAWFYIKKVLKEKDPETWEKLKAEPEEVKEPEEPKETMTIPSEELTDIFFGKPVPANVPEKEDVIVTMEGKEIGTVPAEVIRSAMENVEEIRKRVENAPAEISGTDGQDDMEIIAINTCLGGFQTAGGRLCWYPKAEMGQHYVNLALGDWKRLMALIPKVMSVMKLEN